MEKYILKNQNATIIVNRNGNEVFLSLSTEPIHTDNNTFRYDGSYIDIDTNKKYFVNIKISTMDSKKKNRIEVLGIKNIKDALTLANYAGFDLVLISPNQAPPVAKILDYGKYKYELAKKAKEAKKKQKTVEVKEVKVRYKIDTHDYEVRIKSVRKFIAQGNKVKIVVMLRGREMQHSNLAFDLANRFLTDLADDPVQLEKKPQLEGRNVTLYLAPQS